MAGAEMHNINIKFLQLWNAGHDARLTLECRAGKVTINLKLTLADKPPPHQPACQVRPQPQRSGPSRLKCSEQRAEAQTAAANAVSLPKLTLPKLLTTRSYIQLL